MDQTGLTRKAVTRRIERGSIKVAEKAADGTRLIAQSEVDKIQSQTGFKPDLVTFEKAAKTASFSTAPSEGRVIPDSDEILRGRNLNPDEWEITSMRVNEWDGANGEPMTQLRVNVVKKTSFSQDAWVIPDTFSVDHKPYQAPKDRPELVVFVGDQQAPHQDMGLHKLFLQWLDDNTPDRGIMMGDTVDFPDISRHPGNPEWDHCVQECLNSAYLLLRDYVQSSTDTRWTKLIGNHDERIRARLLAHNTLLHDVRRADIPGDDRELPIWNIGHLLRLEALGIDLINPNGGYSHAQAKVSKRLAARHGWLAKKGSGASALSTLEHLGYSIVVGHTHRQSLVHKTTHDIDGELTTLAAAETGCMCRIQDGLGYTVAPDWQNGFATAAIWPDGTFKLDLATYVNGTLYWRDKRYA